MNRDTIVEDLLTADSPLRQRGYAISPYRMSLMAKTASKIYDQLTDCRISLLSASEARMTLEIVGMLLDRVTVREEK